jgi:hypothetical protein
VAIVGAGEGRSLGRVSSNEFAVYGSPFSAKSITNRFGVYGSEFSAASPLTAFTGSPPKLLFGNCWTYLSANRF